MNDQTSGVFAPKRSDYWCYKFIDSCEMEYFVDWSEGYRGQMRGFRGNREQLLDYLVTNRNMSVSEARSFISRIKRVGDSTR